MQFRQSLGVTCNETMLILVSSILVTCVSSCSDTVASLVNDLPVCMTRPEVIKLEAPLESRVRQMIPSHVTVSRCSGSCQHNIGHTCTPSEYKKVEVPVMFVMDGYRTGMLDTRCGVVNIEEHVDCQCGCHVTRDTCIPDVQDFNNRTCQCVCNNQHLAALCKHESHIWDPRVCQCLCRKDSWKLCPTGYLFDSVHSCDCVPVHYRAVSSLIILMLSVILAIISVVSFIMFRQSRNSRIKRKESLARVLLEDSDED